jgi:hypothetical protein
MGELPQFDGAVATIESAGADGEKVRGGIVSFDALVDDFDERFEGRQHLFDGLATP